jgi:NitT/TauT family transport system substrate-binding protein
MHNFRTALLACSVIAVLTIVGLAPRSGSAQAPLTVVRVSGVISDEMTPVLYALKSGMYAKAGLDVQVVPANSGAAVTTAVLGGSVEIGKSSLIALMNAHLRGVPLAIIGGADVYDWKNPYAQMVTSYDSPIATAKDLIGKTIGVPSLNDLNVLAAYAWLDKNGGDSKSVKFVEIPNSSLEATLTEKRADAAVMTYPFLADAIDSHTVKAIGPAYTAIANSFLITAWFVSTDWATKHPDAVKTFIDVTDRSAAYTNVHHAETAPLVAEATKIPLAVITTMPRVTAGTTLHLADIQPLIDSSAKYKLIPQAFPARDLLLPGAATR